jgi:hypothetical protein
MRDVRDKLLALLSDFVRSSRVLSSRSAILLNVRVSTPISSFAGFQAYLRNPPRQPAPPPRKALYRSPHGFCKQQAEENRYGRPTPWRPILCETARRPDPRPCPYCPLYTRCNLKIHPLSAGDIHIGRFPVALVPFLARNRRQNVGGHLKRFAYFRVGPVIYDPVSPFRM